MKARWRQELIDNDSQINRRLLNFSCSVAWFLSDEGGVWGGGGKLFLLSFSIPTRVVLFSSFLLGSSFLLEDANLHYQWITTIFNIAVKESIFNRSLKTTGMVIKLKNLFIRSHYINSI
jgi:hypothetical protein